MRRKGISAEIIHAASASFYDVLLGGVTWSEVMEKLLPHFNGRTATILIHELNQPKNLYAAGYAPTEVYRAYVEYYSSIDIQRDRANKSSVGELLLCQNWWDDAFIRSSELYQDFLIPNGARYAMGAKVAVQGSLSANFALYRATENSAYSSDQQKSFLPIIHHIGRAMQLHWRLQGLERKLFAQAQALDALNFGVMVCNGYGHVYHANLEAEKILRRVVVIKIIQNRLSCGLAFDQTRLDQLLHSVTQQGISNGLCLRDIATKQEWHLWAVPARDGLGFANERLVVIVITNPNQPPSLDMILQRVFGFTFAEVKLANALVAGITVAEYAQRERISITTARTHVRAILGKVGVRRQTDLLRVIASAGLISTKDR